MLASNGTGTIRDTLVASGPQLGANKTGQIHIFWTVTAANDTDATMESVLFQRQMDIAAIPEFSLASCRLGIIFHYWSRHSNHGIFWHQGDIPVANE
jgi:hypothetical protein